MKEYSDSERAAVHAERSAQEIEAFSRGWDYEVVVLEAASLEILTRTHAQYFKTAAEIVEGGALQERDE